MEREHRQDNEQAKLWNGPAGLAWVESQALLDRLFLPFEERLASVVPAGSALHVLDVGCGTGSTTLAVAARLGAQGRCTGIDLSAPMIATARARALARLGAASTAADFIVADAQRHVFEPAGVDLILSRFGVMFFDDPVAAFANLRRAARDTAELHLIAWRSAAENAFMTTAERAAAPLLPGLPPRRPDAPGQFAFADADRVRRTLQQGGWVDIDIEPIDVPCAMPEPELPNYLSRLGPVGLALQSVDAQTRAQVVEAALAAFEPYLQRDEVRFNAACWAITARAKSPG